MIYQTLSGGPLREIIKYLKHRIGIDNIYTVNVKVKHIQNTMKLYILKVIKDKVRNRLFVLFNM